MKKDSRIKPHILLLFLFIVGSFLFIELNFRYWYCFMEQYMMFQTTEQYFLEHLSEPGGLNEYLTEFISLSFIYPYGAAISIALLLGGTAFCFYQYLKACYLQPSMLTAILPMFLFWAYPQESIATLLATWIALLFVCIYTLIPSTRIRYLLIPVLLTVSHFFAAPANLLIAVMLGIYEYRTSIQKEKFWIVLGSIAYSVCLPLIAMRTCFILPMKEAFFSKHLCHPEFPMPTSLLWIGISFPTLTLLSFTQKKDNTFKKQSLGIIFSFICLIAGIIVGIIYKKDPLEQAYQYDYYARNDQWDKIVSHARQHSIHDMDALVYLNLALSHTGQFIDEFLQYPQKGETGFIPHDPRSRMGLIEANEVAWQIGQINAAQRFAFVGVLSSERCVQPRLMKRLVETYLISGEYKAAEKYIKLLETTPHYREWATAQRSLLDPKVCATTDWVIQKRSLLPITDNPFDLTKAFPSAIAFLIDDHAENRAAFEYGMGYLLLHKDLNTLMYYMEQMKERGESFPKCYQEAICFFFSSIQRNPKAFNSYPISSEIKNRFLQYVKASRTLPKAVLQSQYGDTYYYYMQYAPTLKQQ